jgi:hypothetical protein
MHDDDDALTFCALWSTPTKLAAVGRQPSSSNAHGEPLRTQRVYSGEQITPDNLGSSLAGAVLEIPFEEDGETVWWRCYCVSVDVLQASVCVHYLNNEKSQFQNSPWDQPDHIHVAEERIYLQEASANYPIGTFQLTPANMCDVLSYWHVTVVHIFCVVANIPFAVRWSEATVICVDCGKHSIRVRYSDTNEDCWVKVSERHVRVRSPLQPC